MMNILRVMGSVLLAATIAACGGGGGSAGTTTTGGTGADTTTTTPTTPAAPTLTLSLVDASGAVVADNSVSSGSVVYAKTVVTGADGAAVANKLVVFVSGSRLVSFQPASGQVLTDATGVAKVQLTPASLTSAGAETLTANTTVGTTNLSASLDIQTSQANVALSNFVASQTTLTAFQATSVSVDVAVNGVSAAATPVSVSFSSNCGSFSPAQVNSNSTGKALTTFQASGCVGGTATLSATAVGASVVQTAVTVEQAAPTNVLFVSATPSTIYTAQASFGIKQSTVKFKVVDASGNAIGASTDVRVSLSSSAIASGVVFADTLATLPKILSTDVNGEVIVIVKSGTLPTPLSLDAQLISFPAIVASSAGLSVNSGQPVQSFFSLSASVFNMEGWSYDNESTNVNILLADRLAQPVPAGTPVSFIAEGGQVTASCSVSIDSNGKSGCSVSLISQAYRPSNGRVTVLAYTEGEEAFIDANGNNKYDLGETFYDMGQPFLDSNEDGLWDLTPAEQKVGDATTLGSGIGTSACPAHAFQVSNVANTCNGTWGSTRVRGLGVIVFSTSFAQAPTFFNTTSSGTSFVLSDLNGNAMPFGTAISATISGGTNCTVVESIPASVPNGTNPTTHRTIITKGSEAADTCSGAQLTIKATTPKGNATLLGIVPIP